MAAHCCPSNPCPICFPNQKILATSLDGGVTWFPAESSFVSAEAAADATAAATPKTPETIHALYKPEPDEIEATPACADPKCACHERNEKGQPKAIHVKFPREYVAKHGGLIYTSDGWTCPMEPKPADSTRAAVALELQRLADARLADARLELWKAARHELAKRAAWPRCTDHDKPLRLMTAIVVNGYMSAYTGCTNCGSIRMEFSIPIPPDFRPHDPKRNEIRVDVFDIGAEHGGAQA